MNRIIQESGGTRKTVFKTNQSLTAVAKYVG